MVTKGNACLGPQHIQRWLCLDMSASVLTWYFLPAMYDLNQLKKVPDEPTHRSRRLSNMGFKGSPKVKENTRLWGRIHHEVEFLGRVYHKCSLKVSKLKIPYRWQFIAHSVIMLMLVMMLGEGSSDCRRGCVSRHDLNIESHIMNSIFEKAGKFFTFSGGGRVIEVSGCMWIFERYWWLRIIS